MEFLTCLHFIRAQTVCVATIVAPDQKYRLHTEDAELGRPAWVVPRRRLRPMGRPLRATRRAKAGAKRRVAREQLPDQGLSSRVLDKLDTLVKFRTVPLVQLPQPTADQVIVVVDGKEVLA